jgi:hypothetical protein
MNTYRVTVMVTLDVNGVDESAGIGSAIEKVREAVDDYGQSGRKMWVTGLAKDSRDEYLVFQQK